MWPRPEWFGFQRSQPLARLATVGPDGQPDVVPVGFEYDGVHFYVGGVDPAKTRKVLNVQAGHHQVDLVIDDLVSTDHTDDDFAPRRTVHAVSDRADQAMPQR